MVASCPFPWHGIHVSPRGHSVNDDDGSSSPNYHVPFSAVFVSSAGFHPEAGRTQHLMRLKRRLGEARES